MFRSSISVGHAGTATISVVIAILLLNRAGLERAEMKKAGLKYSGPVAHYDMRRDEIRGKGMVLAVADEVLKACKVENVLFRVWFKVEKIGNE